MARTKVKEPSRIVRAITASASRVSLRPRSQQETPKSQAWQDEIWELYDDADLGELRYAGMFIANALSRLILYVGKRDPKDPDADPIAVTDIGITDALERLRSGFGGHGALLYRGGLNMFLVGECYLVIVAKRAATANDPETPEMAIVCSTDELTKAGKEGKYVLEIAPGSGKKVELSEAEGDLIIRLWVPHPRFAGLADASTKGVRGVCREMRSYARAARAQAKSRVSAGIAVIASELSFGHGAPEEEEGDQGKDPFIEDFIDGLSEPIQNEDSASAVVPNVARVPAEMVDKAIKHVTFDRAADPVMEQRADRAARRLAVGLNVSIETLEGKGGLNHWTGWLITDEDFRQHVAPLASSVMEGFTAGYLWPALEAAGIADAREYVIWFDASRLVQRPNRAQDAKDGHAAHVLSDETLRTALGFGDTDAPSAEELARRMTVERAAIDPLLTQQLLLTVLGLVLPKVAESPTPGGPIVDVAPAEPSEPIPADPAVVASARRGLGQRLAEADRALRLRLTVAADAAMRRALEKAGARLRSKARGDAATKAALASVRPEMAAQHLGPTMVAALGVTDDELLEDSFTAFGLSFDRWARDAQRAALRQVGVTDDAPEWESLTAAQDADRERGWAFLFAALMAQARSLLYDPSPEAPPLGEHDSTSTVPYGLVRSAVGIAGGAQSDFAAPLAEETVLGIGTGPLILTEIEARGGAVEGWEWVYGAYPRERPFKPHLDLDGKRFEHWDDDILRNDEGWPATAHFSPGDHPGCVLGATVVDGPRTLTTFERGYLGEILEIETRGGRVLSCTPNHPILFEGGWIRADGLDVGHRLICGLWSERIPSGMDPDDQQVPSRIEQIAGAFGKRASVDSRSMPTAAEDFHGDGGASEIHVVRSDRQLWNAHFATLAQPFREQGLGSVHPTEILARLGRSFSGFDRVGNSPLGLVRRADDLHPTLGTSARVHQQLSGAQSAGLLTVEREKLGQSLSVSADLVGELLDAGPGLIAFDEVVRIRRHETTCHVYNLSTTQGWYRANGIITHNCVCDWEPVILEPQEAR